MNRTSKLVLCTLISALLALSSSGCSPELLSTAETDQVATTEYPEQNYFDFRTYALPSEVVDLCAEDGGDADVGIGLGGMGGRPSAPDDCRESDHRYDDVILDAFRENMDRLGYREVDPEAEEPDVFFLMGWVSADNWFVYYPYCYYGYYYYYGCWYRPPGVLYSLPTGSLIADMVVVDDSAAGEFSPAWTLAFQGLAQTSSELSAPDRLRRAVNQGFRQSPYLEEGGDN